MKKYNKINTYLAIILSIITTLSNIGCNKDEEIITPSNLGESMLVSDFERLASSERNAIDVFIGKESHKSLEGGRRYMSDNEDIRNDESFLNLANHIESFLSKEDLLADYYENELKKLVISEEEAELLQIDMDEYIEFVQENMSEEYYAITQLLIQDSTSVPSISEISANNNLKLSEKFCLVIVAEAKDYLNKQEKVDKPTDQMSRKDLCSKIRSIERQMCNESLAANVTVSVLELILSKGSSEYLTGAHIAYAIYEYVECMDKADKFYTECLK